MKKYILKVLLRSLISEHVNGKCKKESSEIVDCALRILESLDEN